MVETRYGHWKGREALELSNGRMRVVVLRGGGHISEIRVLDQDRPSVNLLWEAPWETADPQTRAAGRLGQLYGKMPAGPFLAGFTGHALCLDRFGPPSEQEAASGLPLHGEASVRMWDLGTSSGGSLAEAQLPLTKLHIERWMRFAPSSPVLLVEERVRNQGSTPRQVHWVQHVTLGAPLLSPGNCYVDATVDCCKVSPFGYEGREAILKGAEFSWPWAPATDGGSLDMRIPFQQEGRGILAAARVSAGVPIASIVAMNAELALALVYSFRREDFPWVAVWEENCARPDPPWGGTARVRGMEFGTTPWPLGQDVLDAMGDLFDTPAARFLAAGETRAVRYSVCATSVPLGWRRIDSVEVSEGGLTLRCGEQDGSVEIPVEGLGGFLSEGAERR